MSLPPTSTPVPSETLLRAPPFLWNVVSTHHVEPTFQRRETVSIAFPLPIICPPHVGGGRWTGLVGTCPFGLALCCPGSSFLVSSSHSFNIIRLPFRCFWTLMAMVCSHMCRIALRRSSCYESGWSLVTAAAMPHGDYLNRMAHTHVFCVHIYTHTHIHVHVHVWTAMLCASRLLLVCRCEQPPGDVPPAQLQLQHHTALYSHGAYMR